MSNETKPATNAPPKPSRPEAVPVKLIRFSETIDIPGAQLNGETVRGRNPAEKRPTGQYHEVELQPWARRFRIAYFEGGKEQATKVSYVHETFAKTYEEW